MKSIKAIFRRGQTSNSKNDGQIQTPEDLSRSSSFSNLNVVEHTPTKSKAMSIKPRKTASRDKLDKISSGTGTSERKHDKKGLTKNNNKIETEEPPIMTFDSLEEVECLKSQLQLISTEKTDLSVKLTEQKEQISSLEHQIEGLKMYQEQNSSQLEQLMEENTVLRNRLRDVAHSPLSDNEKQQLLYESHRHHNSAPASIVTNPLEDSNTSCDANSCPTPEWDKHSSSNVSEISVACLQDKINQMQETHYSTNEELQATLQELTDLQRQLTELQQENERLLEEKNLMFDSLCRQTERLKDARQEMENLKVMLYRGAGEKSGDGAAAAAVAGAEMAAQAREEKLVDLLKSAQDEQESLLVKHETLSGELEALRLANEDLSRQAQSLAERNGTLEGTLEAKNAEHKLLDREVELARDQSSGRQIEINRLRDMLENARTKINELEQNRTLSDKSELDELLDNARKEKDTLESEVTYLKEQLARSKNEAEKLREQVSILQEECKVIRNNARTIQSDLEYKCEKLLSEKAILSDQLRNFQELINDLQVQAQCQAEDKRNLSDVLAETQRNLSESERKIISLENELMEVKKLRREENEEWEKFQNDLLTSVRVANDFKTEAQQDLQRMIMENKEHRDKVKVLEAQLDKLQGLPFQENSTESREPAKKHSVKKFSQSLPNLFEILGKNEANNITNIKKPKWMKHRKQLSQQEKEILKTLEQMHDEIGLFTPDHLLTTEQAVVKKLKHLYEDEQFSYYPVAPKVTLGNLVISEPLFVGHKCSNNENSTSVKTIAPDEKFSRTDETEDAQSRIRNFSTRLKTALENMGEKCELKKRSSIRNYRDLISFPTEKSVMENSKLCAILKTRNGDLRENGRLEGIKECLEDVNKVSKCFEDVAEEEGRGNFVTNVRVSSNDYSEKSESMEISDDDAETAENLIVEKVENLRKKYENDEIFFDFDRLKLNCTKKYSEMYMESEDLTKIEEEEELEDNLHTRKQASKLNLEERKNFKSLPAFELRIPENLEENDKHTSVDDRFFLTIADDLEKKMEEIDVNEISNESERKNTLKVDVDIHRYQNNEEISNTEKPKENEESVEILEPRKLDLDSLTMEKLIEMEQDFSRNNFPIYHSDEKNEEIYNSTCFETIDDTTLNDVCEDTIEEEEEKEVEVERKKMKTIFKQVIKEMKRKYSKDDNVKIDTETTTAKDEIDEDKINSETLPISLALANEEQFPYIVTTREISSCEKIIGRISKENFDFVVENYAETLSKCEKIIAETDAFLRREKENCFVYEKESNRQMGDINNRERISEDSHNSDSDGKEPMYQNLLQLQEEDIRENKRRISKKPKPLPRTSFLRVSVYDDSEIG